MINLVKKLLLGLAIAFASTMASAAPCNFTNNNVTANPSNVAANLCMDHPGNDEQQNYENAINNDFSLNLNWSFITSKGPNDAGATPNDDSTGTWDLSAYTISNPFVIVLKAGNNFAAYLLNVGGATSVDWDTIDLPTNGNNPIDLSHISLYTSTGGPGEVPLPAAVWLFGSALMGLVGIRKRYTA